MPLDLHSCRSTAPMPFLFLTLRQGAWSKVDSLAESLQNTTWNGNAISAGCYSRWAGFGPCTVLGPSCSVCSVPAEVESVGICLSDWEQKESSDFRVCCCRSDWSLWTPVMLQHWMLLDSWTFGIYLQRWILPQTAVCYLYWKRI